jgi:biotin carboxylase
VLLVMRTRTYRAKAFLRAAERVGLNVSVATDREQPLAQLARGGTVALDFTNTDRAVGQIEEFADEYPIDAVVGVDDDTTVLAAQLAEALQLPHNSVESVKAARYKDVMRLALSEADGLLSPAFWLLSTDEEPWRFAAEAAYPVVLKPLSLAASRGVIRANNAAEFIEAFKTIVDIISELEPNDPGASRILVEEFIPGAEVALEGILIGGKLTSLALFDKPDPLDGPYFEETIYVTPSRLPDAAQRLISETTERAALALGLRTGPVHAELRLNERGAWLVEVAPRSIGGLCSSTLRFGDGVSLEEIILRQAANVELISLVREQRPAGVMMIPIPSSSGGILRSIEGVEAARAVAGITDLTISIPCGEWVEPLPRASRYLGFIYAAADRPQLVEAALRQAHQHLSFEIVSP